MSTSNQLLHLSSSFIPPPPLTLSLDFLQPAECLWGLLLSTCCSLHPLSPWKLSFASLLILFYLPNFLGLTLPPPTLTPVISPTSLFSLLWAFYLSLYHFLNPSSLSSFSVPSDSACLALSHRCVCSVSQSLTLWPTFFSSLFFPFSILSPSSLASLPLPEETVTNYSNLRY